MKAAWLALGLFLVAPTVVARQGAGPQLLNEWTAEPVRKVTLKRLLFCSVVGPDRPDGTTLLGLHFSIRVPSDTADS